jgi:hypothetical protein
VPKLKIKSKVYPIELQIDGASIDATVTRFTLAQFSEFKRGWNRLNEPHSERLISVRMPGEEQERLPKEDGTPGEFAISAEEIRRRRLVEMTDEQRAEYNRLHDEEEAFAAQLMEEMLSRHLRIKPGQIEVEDPDGVLPSAEVRTGEEFVRMFGGRDEVLGAAFRAIYIQNILPESVKNSLSSQSASQPGSSGSEQTDPKVSGLRPDARAESASSEGSATSEAATASSEKTSCGSTSGVLTTVS